MDFVTATLAAFVSIFVIVDPFAVLPVYLSISGDLTVKEQRRVCLKSVLVAGVILTCFALSGMAIFNIFGIQMEAFRIAGGILLASMGYMQLNSKRRRIQPKESQEADSKEDIAVFPMAMPLLAGPGAISTVVLYATKYHDQLSYRIGLVIAIILSMLASYLVLRGSVLIQKALGVTGLNLMTRILGIVLMSIGVQFVIHGVTSVYQKIQ